MQAEIKPCVLTDDQKEGLEALDAAARTAWNDTLVSINFRRLGEDVTQQNTIDSAAVATRLLAWAGRNECAEAVAVAASWVRPWQAESTAGSKSYDAALAQRLAWEMKDGAAYNPVTDRYEWRLSATKELVGFVEHENLEALAREFASCYCLNPPPGVSTSDRRRLAEMFPAPHAEVSALLDAVAPSVKQLFGKAFQHLFIGAPVAGVHAPSSEDVILLPDLLNCTTRAAFASLLRLHIPRDAQQTVDVFRALERVHDRSKRSEEREKYREFMAETFLRTLELMDNQSVAAHVEKAMGNATWYAGLGLVLATTVWVTMAFFLNFTIGVLRTQFGYWESEARDNPSTLADVVEALLLIPRAVRIVEATRDPGQRALAWTFPHEEQRLFPTTHADRLTFAGYFSYSANTPGYAGQAVGYANFVSLNVVLIMVWVMRGRMFSSATPPPSAIISPATPSRWVSLVSDQPEIRSAASVSSMPELGRRLWKNVGNPIWSQRPGGAGGLEGRRAEQRDELKRVGRELADGSGGLKLDQLVAYFAGFERLAADLMSHRLGARGFPAQYAHAVYAILGDDDTIWANISETGLYYYPVPFGASKPLVVLGWEETRDYDDERNGRPVIQLDGTEARGLVRPIPGQTRVVAGLWPLLPAEDTAATAANPAPTASKRKSKKGLSVSPSPRPPPPPATPYLRDLFFFALLQRTT